MPVVSLIGVLQVIWDLRVFTQIHVRQQSGGITQQTNLLGTYVYQVGISQGDDGTASALAMMILLLTLVITDKYLQMRWTQGDIRCRLSTWAAWRRAPSRPGLPVRGVGFSGAAAASASWSTRSWSSSRCCGCCRYTGWSSRRCSCPVTSLRAPRNSWRGPPRS